MKISALPSLLRIHNAVFGALTVVTSVFLINPPNFFIVLLSGLVAYVSLSSAGNVINDIYDVKIDKINRPERPIPSGRISKREAKRIYLVLVILGLSASLYSSLLRKSIIPFIIAAVFTGMGLLYSAKLKVMGFIGSILVGVSFAIGYIYGLFISAFPPRFSQLIKVLLFFTVSTTLLISREIIKGIEDIEGDRERGVKTLARTIGVEKSAMVAIAFGAVAIVSYTTLGFIGDFGIVFIPFLFLGDASAGLSLILTVFGRKYISKASFFSKVGMFTGLVGFFLASFPRKWSLDLFLHFQLFFVFN